MRRRVGGRGQHRPHRRRGHRSASRDRRLRRAAAFRRGPGRGHGADGQPPPRKGGVVARRLPACLPGGARAGRGPRRAALAGGGVRPAAGRLLRRHGRPDLHRHRRADHGRERRPGARDQDEPPGRRPRDRAAGPAAGRHVDVHRRRLQLRRADRGRRAATFGRAARRLRRPSRPTPQRRSRPSTRPIPSTTAESSGRPRRWPGTSSRRRPSTTRPAWRSCPG